MSSSPAIELPSDLVRRYHALQAARAARTAGRCDCQCGRCAERASAQAPTPRNP